MNRRGDSELRMRTSEINDANRTVSSRINTRFLKGRPLGNDCDDNTSEITLVSGDLTKNMTVTPVTPVSDDGVIYPYSIFGNIVDEGAVAIEGASVIVTVTDGGAAVDTVTTDASGNYRLWFIYDGEYTITPSKSGYTITATNVTVSGDNQEKDFVAIAIEQYSFTKRRTITLESDSVALELTDYPAYIYITGLDKANLRTDGQDVMFFLSNDTTRLPLEIEEYDDSGATGVLHAWVKIPTLSSSADTVLYMYYNDSNYTQPARDTTFGSESVWNSNYFGVWHMKDDPDITHIKDSTSKEWIGTKSSSNSGPIESSAQVGFLQTYATVTNDRIDIPHNADLMPSEITISCIYKRLGGSDNYMVGKDAVGYTSYELRLAAGKLTFKGRDSEATVIIFTGNTTLTIGTPYYIQGVYGYDGGTIHKLYVNKNDETLTESGGGNDNGVLSQADTNQLTLGYYSVMQLHEIRLSSIMISKDQHDTEFDNLLTPGTFLTIGAETNDSKSN